MIIRYLLRKKFHKRFNLKKTPKHVSNAKNISSQDMKGDQQNELMQGKRERGKKKKKKKKKRKLK